MAKPIVSVLMTAYNREAYIVDAIESVLASTLTDFELIIVDDCSTDNTLKVVEPYRLKDRRIRVYKNENNLGDYSNRNKAASYATGKYIKYLDSDDFMYPHCLQTMVSAMEAFPEAGLGLSSIGDINKPYPVCIKPKQAYLEHFYGFGHFDRAPGSAIINKEVFDSVGGFSGKRMIGDYELWFIICSKYNLVKFPRDLFWDRVHSGSESKSKYAQQYDALKKQILTNVLSHSDCPLSEEEVRDIYKIRKAKAIRERVVNLFKRIV